MAEIHEIKRPDWRDPQKGLQNLLEDWKNGVETLPAGAALVTIGEDGGVSVFSYGTIGTELEIVGAFAVGQAALTQSMGSGNG